jgi:hypothetical protein
MTSPSQRRPSPPLVFAEAWLALWRYSTAWTWGGLASFAQVYDTRSLRAFWSSQMTQAMDRYMRSPEFLELMASGLRTLAGLTRLNSQLRTR